MRDITKFIDHEIDCRNQLSDSQYKEDESSDKEAEDEAEDEQDIELLEKLIGTITELLEETHTDLDACRYLDTNGEHSDSDHHEHERYQGQEVEFKDSLEGYEGGEKIRTDNSNKSKSRSPTVVDAELIIVNSDESIGIENNPIQNMNITTTTKPKSPKAVKTHE